MRRCRDGELVVHHDPRIDGRAIAELRRGDLPRYVPSLETALDACAGARVNVEVKNLRDGEEASYDPTGDFARAVVEAVGAARRSSEVIYSSFDFATCVALATAGPSPVGWLLDVDVDPTAAVDRASGAALAALNPYVGVVDGPLVARARAAGLGLNVWTVNAPADLASMFELAVDVVITDDPVLALALRPRS